MVNICKYPIIYRGFIHPRWLFRISSINSINKTLDKTYNSKGWMMKAGTLAGGKRDYHSPRWSSLQEEAATQSPSKVFGQVRSLLFAKVLAGNEWDHLRSTFFSLNGKIGYFHMPFWVRHSLWVWKLEMHPHHKLLDASCTCNWHTKRIKKWQNISIPQHPLPFGAVIMSPSWTWNCCFIQFSNSSSAKRHRLDAVTWCHIIHVHTAYIHPKWYIT